MTRVLAVLLAAISLFVVTAAPALAADNVVHYPLTFSEESSGPIDDAAGCIGYEGIIYEERTYDIRVTEFVDGPNAGNVQLTGVIRGDFTIEPAEGETGAVYEGSYREKVTFTGTSFDDPRVNSWTLPASATGADGSRLKFLMHGHFVVDEDGEIEVEVFRFNCIQAATQ